MMNMVRGQSWFAGTADCQLQSRPVRLLPRITSGGEYAALPSPRLLWAALASQALLLSIDDEETWDAITPLGIYIPAFEHKLDQPVWNEHDADRETKPDMGLPTGKKLYTLAIMEESQRRRRHGKSSTAYPPPQNASRMDTGSQYYCSSIHLGQGTGSDGTEFLSGDL
ncbi:hypothetical protein IF1G_03791 [Cordyceps javanica]|uniref:Uncharacterized protein n=1 Tax=Cordyceps javanica TaxID=43265 RepID=A0A545V8J6_9HYPO|nr:hypothetical protein IF1G_03791 [Cordyceps javanica]